MADLIDKAILLGLGLEKKLKETLEEAQSSRKEDAKASESKEGTEGEAAATEGTKPLTPRQIIENRVVEDGSAVLKELLTVVVSAKDKIESEIISNSARVADKLHVATDIEMDVVKEMARIAREKVDALEARVEALERKAGKE